MNHKGLYFALAAMLISGISVFANAQLVKGMDPMVQTTIKNGIVGVMLVAWMLLRGKLGILKTTSWKKWLPLLTVAVIGGSLAFGLFFTGLKMTGAVEGGLIQKSMVIWIMLLSIPFLKEKLPFWMALSAVGLYIASFIGGATISSFGTAQLMVLTATLLWSVEAVVVRKMVTTSTMDVDTLLFGRMVLGSLLLMGYLMMTGKVSQIAGLSPVQWQGLLAVSMLLFGYVMMWYRALKFTPAVEVSSILVGATVITMALTSLTTGKITGNQLIQVGVMAGLVSAVVLGILSSRKYRKTPSAVLSET
jgi:drug/metabolite transporter (DMT)-like permease